MGGFKNERTAILFLLQFLLMARFEEVATLRKENVVVIDSGDMEVKILEAKILWIVEQPKVVYHQGEI